MWLRPGAREFVCHLLNDPRCTVAIYTSMKSHNMEDVVHAFDNHFEDLSRKGQFDDVIKCHDDVNVVLYMCHQAAASVRLTVTTRDHVHVVIETR
mgnify:CR=1 FL=1